MGGEEGYSGGTKRSLLGLDSMSSKSGADDKHRERVCAEVRECGCCLSWFYLHEHFHGLSGLCLGRTGP